jgi:hypothetical protein
VKKAKARPERWVFTRRLHESSQVGDPVGIEEEHGQDRGDEVKAAPLAIQGDRILILLDKSFEF